MPENFGEQFLHKRNPELHKDSNVEHEMHRQKSKGEKVSQKPADKLEDWMHVLERTHMTHRDDPRVMERIKNYYHKQHVLKEENIPQSYWDSQGEMIARDGRLGDLQASGVNIEEIQDEEGHKVRHFHFSEKSKHEQAEVVIADQKSTLDNWIDYFISPDSDSYPMWSKYWAFTGMLKLSSYDKANHSFGKRDKTTIAPFPDLDREALAYTVDYLVKKYGEDNIKLQTDIKLKQSQLQKIEKYDKQLQVVETGQDSQGNTLKEEVLEQMKQRLKKPLGYEDQEQIQEEFQQLQQKQATLLGDEERTVEDKETKKDILATEEFGKLYAYAIEKVTPAEANELLNTQGTWVTFPKDADPMTDVPEGFDKALVPSLQGHGTGWCTAGETTAREQLKGGNFHVYYSHDKNGKASVPRIAIRMEGENIAEVRGIAPEQNLDSYIGEVVEDKLQEFGSEGEAYSKKVQDMNHLTEIEKKHHSGDTLSKEDLRFLYEFDGTIKGFGYMEDPRVIQIRADRDIKLDLSVVTGFTEDQICITENIDFNDFLRVLDGYPKIKDLEGGIEFNYGDIDVYDETLGDKFEFPKHVMGSVHCSKLLSAEGLRLPKYISGDLNLESLTSTEGLELPEHIGGDLNLESLTSIEGLELPKRVGGYINVEAIDGSELKELQKKYPHLTISSPFTGYETIDPFDIF